MCALQVRDTYAQMCAEGHTPSVHTFIRLITVCGRLDEPHAALRLLEEVTAREDKLSSDPRIHNAAIRCVIRLWVGVFKPHTRGLSNMSACPAE